MENKKLTPMLRQYFDIKKDYPDSILFFRMGDFYEMFFEDAKIAAPILEVVLTSRDKNKANSIPMCGVPHHAKDNYASKLLRQGYKVAICEQVEDPAQAKGIVKRDVTRVLTPATALELEQGEQQLNNFVVSIFSDDNHLAAACIDLGVGEFEVRCYDRSNREGFINEIYIKSPKEIVVRECDLEDIEGIFRELPEISTPLFNQFSSMEYNFMENREILKNQLKIESIEGLGLTGYDSAVISAGVLIKYLRSVRKGALANLSSLRFIPQENSMIVDSISFKNLEILTNLRTGSKKGSLFDAVDYTITPMGKRLLKRWLSYPLIEKNGISYRQDGIEEFTGNLIPRTETRRLLKSAGDLAKLNSRISLNIALPVHLLVLKDTLSTIPLIKEELSGFRSQIVSDALKELNPLKEVVKMISDTISDDPPNNLSDGNYIRRGFSSELDELRDISLNAKAIVSAMEATEREKTGISTLKIKFNKVFGYFIEVTKTHMKLVPDTYIRKQTLVNCERFITGELKELEEKILKAEEKILVIEKHLYQELIDKIQAFSLILNSNADTIALLDVLAGGGELAGRRDYIRPSVNDGVEVRIQEGKHPVVDMSSSKEFIPNDTNLNSNGNQILVITGPNMGGKSTYLRQNALIVLLAQIGYFVPANKAVIGICDRIFTRIGASDSLIEGKSTFLIEMIETAVILNNATRRSLILLDEIGRGTSTFDGLSIAWAVIEYLHSLKEKPKTLFATHYHELTELSEILDRVKNYHIAVREWQENVVFLHKIVEGATDQSFGIHVAKIAGVPSKVIERAKSVLLNLEKKELDLLVKERISGNVKDLPAKQKKLFPDDEELKVWDDIREKLKEIDISNITPLESLNILHYLKHKSDSFK